MRTFRKILHKISNYVKQVAVAYHNLNLWAWLFLLTLFVLISFIGSTLNLSVVHANGCRMPVFTKADISFANATHFAYNQTVQVKYPLLTDWIKTESIGIVSIGDMLILFGLFGVVFAYVLGLSLSFIYHFMVKRKSKKMKGGKHG